MPAAPARTAAQRQSRGGQNRGGQSRGGEQMDFEDLKRLIHGKLVDKLDLSRLGDLEGDTLRREIRLVVEHLCDTENPLLNRGERERLVEEVLDETFGFGPLEILLKEEGIADIMINGPKTIFIEKEGRIQKSPVTFRDNDHLLQILDRIVSPRWAGGSTRPARCATPGCRTAPASTPSSPRWPWTGRPSPSGGSGPTPSPSKTC